MSFDADESGTGSYEIYLVPTLHVEDELKKNHKAYIDKPALSGEKRKDGDQRNLHLNKRVDAPEHGYASHWASFMGHWQFDGHRDSIAPERR